MYTTDINKLVTSHGKAVYNFCYSLTKNEADCDDLYQETFLKAMELCHKIDEDNNPKGFLIGIAIRLWKNKCRKHSWRQRIAPTETIDDSFNSENKFIDEKTPEDIVVSNELTIMIRNAIDKMHDKYKIPLYMYYTAELSIEEIASVMKIPKGTVKSRLHKARKLLQNNFEVNEYVETRKIQSDVKASSITNC